ncbi:MAG: Maf family protein [bacterium]|nr:Maf family protein [bacterium]
MLGSQSKGRSSVMESMGFQFETMSANIDEKAIRFDDPQKLTLVLANAKADALLPNILEPAILITSDQVVALDKNILEKPENEDEAREFLRGYATHPPQTVTAVVAVNTATKERREGVDIAKVVFKEIPESVIDEIIKEGDIFTRAGGFSVEDPRLKNYIVNIEGAIDSIIGLPKELTERLIKEVQWPPKTF